MRIAEKWSTVSESDCVVEDSTYRGPISTKLETKFGQCSMV